MYKASYCLHANMVKFAVFCKLRPFLVNVDSMQPKTFCRLLLFIFKICLQRIKKILFVNNASLRKKRQMNTMRIVKFD